MPRKEKVKHPMLSMIPVKTEMPEEQLVYKKSTDKCPCVVSDFSLERIADSITKADSAGHHTNMAHAEKAMNLQHKWESLPIYHEGDYFPKRQLFSNFKRVVLDVFENKKA